MRAKLLLAFAIGCSAYPGLLAAPRYSPLDRQTMPDRLEMNDGRTLQGLSLKNTAKEVRFQTRAG
ncbi:MAG: hypothetical protein ACO39C_10050, partial [Chthoniobacterales bacterium]